jgi:hypothetical protein
MILPLVLPGMIERNNGFREWIDGGYFRTFGVIAAKTGKRQVC